MFQPVQHNTLRRLRGMQKVRDIDNHCLVTCQQRAAACELPHTKSCAVLGSMYHVTAKITPATAVAGFHNHKQPLKSAFPMRMRLRRRTACRMNRAWGAKQSIHATGTATVPRPNAWLVMKSVPNPAKTPVAGSAERGDLGK